MRASRRMMEVLDSVLEAAAHGSSAHPLWRFSGVNHVQLDGPANRSQRNAPFNNDVLDEQMRRGEIDPTFVMARHHHQKHHS